MGDFSADWLALREPADRRARSAALVERLAAWLSGPSHPAGGCARPLTVLDLGCGTGANLRYLAPILGPILDRDQSWTCLDLDPDLLRALPHRTAAWATGQGMDVQPAGEGGLRIQRPGATWEVRTQAFDLSRGIGALPLEPGTMVVASALLDLVSEDWLTGLLRTCAGAKAPLLLTLTYDGQVTIDPALPLDGIVIGLVNAHQGRDKGFGRALGPSACARLDQLGETLGFSVDLAESDWRLDSADTDLQIALAQGWAAAALEQAAAFRGPEDLALMTSIRQWQKERCAQIAAKRSCLRVGHQDALLLPRWSVIGSQPRPCRTRKGTVPQPMFGLISVSKLKTILQCCCQEHRGSAASARPGDA